MSRMSTPLGLTRKLLKTKEEKKLSGKTEGRKCGSSARKNPEAVNFPSKLTRFQ